MKFGLTDDDATTWNNLKAQAIAGPMGYPQSQQSDAPEPQIYGLPAPPEFHVSNPLHAGVLGKRAIGGLKWGDLLGVGLALASPRGALEALGGFQNSVDRQRQQGIQNYQEMLPIWQRQEAEKQDAIDKAATLAEQIRYHDAMVKLGGERIDAGTFGRVLPYDPNAAANLPGAPEGFTPTPGGMGTFERNAGLLKDKETNTGLNVSKAFGINATPGLSYNGPVTGGTIGVSNANAAYTAGPKTDNTQSQITFRDNVQTPNVQARTADTKAMTPVKVRKGNAVAKVAEQTPQHWQDMIDAAANRAAASASAAMARTIVTQNAISQRNANKPAKKGPKPTESEQLQIWADKSGVAPQDLKLLMAAGFAPGPKLRESIQYWRDQHVITPIQDNSGKVVRWEFDPTSKPERRAAFIQDQARFRQGKPWIGDPTYNGPKATPQKIAAPSGGLDNAVFVKLKSGLSKGLFRGTMNDLVQTDEYKSASHEQRLAIKAAFNAGRKG